MSGSVECTFQGHIASTHDALLIFECVRRGIMPKVKRRLRDDDERSKLIRSGQVFVFDERESGIKRWTDGLLWSPSRILLNFLVYRQVDKKFSANSPPFPSQSDNALMSSHGFTSEYNPLALGVSGFEEPGGLVAAAPLSASGSREGFDMGRPRSISAASESHAAWDPFPSSSSSAAAQRDPNSERNLVGSLTSSYPFAKDGLCKKTISIQTENSTQHLISYYTADDVRSGRLRTPSSLPEVASLPITSIFLTKTTFRFPPSIAYGPDGIARFHGEDVSSRQGEHDSSGSSGSEQTRQSNSQQSHPTGRPKSHSLSRSMARARGPPLSHQIGGSGSMIPGRRTSDNALRASRGRFVPYPGGATNAAAMFGSLAQQQGVSDPFVLGAFVPGPLPLNAENQMQSQGSHGSQQMNKDEYGQMGGLQGMHDHPSVLARPQTATFSSDGSSTGAGSTHFEGQGHSPFMHSVPSQSILDAHMQRPSTHSGLPGQWQRQKQQQAQQLPQGQARAPPRPQTYQPGTSPARPMFVTSTTAPLPLSPVHSQSSQSRPRPISEQGPVMSGTFLYEAHRPTTSSSSWAEQEISDLVRRDALEQSSRNLQGGDQVVTSGIPSGDNLPWSGPSDPASFMPGSLSQMSQGHSTQGSDLQQDQVGHQAWSSQALDSSGQAQNLASNSALASLAEQRANFHAQHQPQADASGVPYGTGGDPTGQAWFSENVTQGGQQTDPSMDDARQLLQDSHMHASFPAMLANSTPADRGGLEQFAEGPLTTHWDSTGSMSSARNEDLLAALSQERQQGLQQRHAMNASPASGFHSGDTGRPHQ